MEPVLTFYALYINVPGSVMIQGSVIKKRVTHHLLSQANTILHSKAVKGYIALWMLTLPVAGTALITFNLPVHIPGQASSLCIMAAH